MNSVKIGGVEYPLFWDIFANDKIFEASKESGCKNFGEWLESKDQHAYGTILYELICGGIRHHNSKIRMGLTAGEIIPLLNFPDDERYTIMSMARIRDFRALESMRDNCYTESSAVSVPDELKKYIPDDDYMEIAAMIEESKQGDEKN